ncbi:MAG TPA: glycosyltransferase family 4 protein [Pseudonocardiaceae bacterium]|nr:glycosyltransferase family 4 protein [Pseudonocardiaceae bacterium]
MRIGMVSPGYPPTLGGVEVVVARTATALVRAGHTVEVLAADRARTSVTEDEGVVVRRFRSSRSVNFPVAPGLWRYVRAFGERYDVLHGHGYHTLGALGAALVAPRARFVFSPHYHGTGHSAPRAVLHHVYRPVGRLGFRRAETVVCVSEAEARIVRAHFPGTRTRIHVVPNAVDVAGIQAAQPFADGGGAPTVLSVGRLEPYKRVDRLIRAFASVPARLVVIGDGPDRARLEGLAGDRVRFLGRIDDGELWRWYRTARVVCSLSEHEAFGLTAAEAVAAGARVVLSDIPAHAELGRATRLVSAAACDAEVAAVLTEVLRDKGPGPSADGMPTWDDVAARLVELYDRSAL